MSPVLQTVLCLAVVTLTIFLVLLLLQARRTAAAVERLAESAARDLHLVAEDVHEVRRQVDEAAGVIRQSFALPSTLTQVASGVVRALPALFGGRSGKASWMEPLLAGIQTAVALLRRPSAAAPTEEVSHD